MGIINKIKSIYKKTDDVVGKVVHDIDRISKIPKKVMLEKTDEVKNIINNAINNNHMAEQSPEITVPINQEHHDEVNTTQTPKKRISGFENYLNNLQYIKIVPDITKIKEKKKKASEIGEIKLSNLTRSTNIDKVKNFVVIDLETTGISLRNNIIEVCAIKFDDYLPVSCFTTLINPERSIPPEATQVNNITDDMVKDAPLFCQIAQQLIDFVGDYTIVGHNVTFDLRHLFVNHVDFTHNKIFDTFEIAKKQLKGYDSRKANWCYDHDKDYDWDVDNYKLDTICEYCGLYRDNAHRATSDCMATAFIFSDFCWDKIEGYNRIFCNTVLSDIEIN